MTGPSVFLVAGEASGDVLGAGLMAGLRSLAPDVRFAGVGGPAMEAEGMASLFDHSELSVMGLAEVLPRYPHLRRRMLQSAAAAIAARPDVLVTIDSPDFGLRVARRVRAAAPGIRNVHYVAPSVWAWRPGRAAKMARHVDQVLALLPFEPPLMEAAGMRCDFVGHPAAAAPVATDDAVAAFRSRTGLGGSRVLLVLPGSRMGEVRRLAPLFGAALRPVLARHPDLRVVVPAAASVADAVRDAVLDWPGGPVILDPRGRTGAAGEKRAAFAAGAAALAASGTVSLELAQQGTPMVIGYDMNRLTWAILSRTLRVDSVTLVNLVTGTRTIPERLGPACTPEALAGDLMALIEDEGAHAAQRRAMGAAMAALGRGGEAPGIRAARAILDASAWARAGYDRVP